MIARVRKPSKLRGTLHLPGDKSISHRALLFNAIAAGTSRVGNLAAGEDVASTRRCLQALGVHISDDGVVAGVGLHGLHAPKEPLDCGNSGTTMRLLAGLLAGARITAELTGDASLAHRPMERVATPLRRMGADVEAGPPLRIQGGQRLTGTEHVMELPSAQVKSCLLLAGLFASGVTRVVEPLRTRDHSERMLAAMAAPIRKDGLAVEVRGADRLDPLSFEVPGDLSSAAFWIVAASLHPDARLTLPGMGVNPTRAAFLRLLPAARSAEHLRAGEPVATLTAATVRGLKPFPWREGLAAELIDELPVLALAATQLPGVTRIGGAAELRVKESDRIATVAAGLRSLGADLDELEDGWEVRGPTPLHGARVSSAGDHRVAMALAVAGLLAEGETEIEGAESAAVSYPGFWDDLEAVCSG